MKSLKYTFAIVFSLLFTNITLAQTPTAVEEPEKLSLNSGTLDNQFEFVIRRSPRWQDYKNVKTNWLYTLKAHTLDSIKALQVQLDDTKAVVTTKQTEIDELKTNLSSTQSNLDATNIEKDSMNLFGLQMSKGSYNTMLWSVIGALLALLLFFIYKFRNSNAITKLAKHNLSEIETEFEEHRRSALEREQKVRRQLQDELNKQKNN